MCFEVQKGPFINRERGSKHQFQNAHHHHCLLSFQLIAHYDVTRISHNPNALKLYIHAISVISAFLQLHWSKLAKHENDAGSLV